MSDATYRQKYQFYSNGRYALVDAHYRTVWFVLNNEAVAHILRKVFVSKLTLLVFDLTTFSNFDVTTNTVDTDVCLDWQVSPTMDPGLMLHQLSVSHFDQTQVNYSHRPLLINQSADTLLTRDQQLELQDQMFLYLRIYQALNIAGISAFWNNQRCMEKLLPQIDSVLQIELSMAHIEHTLDRLCRTLLEQFPGECSRILYIMKKTLYA